MFLEEKCYIFKLNAFLTFLYATSRSYIVLIDLAAGFTL